MPKCVAWPPAKVCRLSLPSDSFTSVLVIIVLVVLLLFVPECLSRFVCSSVRPPIASPVTAKAQPSSISFFTNIRAAVPNVKRALITHSLISLIDLSHADQSRWSLIRCSVSLISDHGLRRTFVGQATGIVSAWKKKRSKRMCGRLFLPLFSA
ncbi:hypothetical protein niasHT_020033 [Heterodera trifolii]|uniref:Uncharacterized protein n=1 Tax=Heterodera trifolii TaxID=157864 RepID=A0ABD2IJD9_9BILA